MEGALAMGGWLNGRWEPGLRRAGSRPFVRDEAITDLVDRAFEAPNPPSRWISTNKPRLGLKTAAIDLDREGDYLVDPISFADLIERHRASAFQVREDLSAAFFVCGSRKVRAGPDGVAIDTPVYEYCDQDVRVRLATDTHGISLDRLLAPRLVRTSPFAVSDGELSLLYVRNPDGKTVRPGPELYRRLLDAITAALTLGPEDKQLKVGGCYTAGVWMPYKGQTFWIDRKEPAESSRMSDSVARTALSRPTTAS
jgi:hypothetical protein